MTRRFRDFIAGTFALVLLSTVGLSAAEPIRLVAAVKSGDQAAVRALLKQPGNVNAAEADGMTALHWAVYGDNNEVVEALLAAGANPNARSTYGVSPLALAVENGNPAIVERLLKRGAKASEEVAAGTALHVAARTGNVDVAKLLVASGASADAREKWFAETPLMVAAAAKQLAMVKYLTEVGANVNLVAKASELSIGPGFPNSPITQVPRGGMTALSIAARAGCFACAEALIAAGANVNHQDRGRVTPLNLAIYNGNLDLAALLLEKGANVNDDSLYLAIEIRNAGVQDSDKLTRLAPEIAHNKVDALELAKRLIAKGADPNVELTRELQSRVNFTDRQTSVNGFTALQKAAQTADVEMMRLLLDAGADPNRFTFSQEALLSQDTSGNFALMMAIRSGGGRELAYRARVAGDSLQAVRLLLEKGANPNVHDFRGLTPLHLAAQLGSVEMIQLLADHGVNLDIRDDNNRTALEIAAARRGRADAPAAAPGAAPEVPPAAALLRKLMALPASTEVRGRE